MSNHKTGTLARPFFNKAIFHAAAFWGGGGVLSHFLPHSCLTDRAPQPRNALTGNISTMWTLILISNGEYIPCESEVNMLQHIRRRFFNYCLRYIWDQ